jgi:hypothetical protein
MKKLFVLFLCLMAVAGSVSAGAVHPPGEISPALPGYGVDDCAVTPDTVLAAATLGFGLPGRIEVVSDMMIVEMPRIVFTVTGIDPGWIVSDVSAAGADYPLRL